MLVAVPDRVTLDPVVGGGQLTVASLVDVQLTATGGIQVITPRQIIDFVLSERVPSAFQNSLNHLEKIAPAPSELM